MGFVFEKGQLQFKDRELSLVTDQGTEILASDTLKDGAKSYWGVSHKHIIKDIYDSIRQGKEPMVTIDHAIRATELVLLCYEQNR